MLKIKRGNPHARGVILCVVASIIISFACFCALRVFAGGNPYLASGISTALICCAIFVKRSLLFVFGENGSERLFVIIVLIMGFAFATLFFWFFHGLLWTSAMISQLLSLLILHLFFLIACTFRSKYLLQENEGVRSKVPKILILAAAFVQPQILLLHYCASNVQYYELGSTIMLGMFLSSISLFLFLLVSLHTGMVGALFYTLFLCVTFWLYPVIHKTYSVGIFFFVVLTITAILLYVLPRHTPDFLTGSVLAAVVLVLFSYNLIESVVHTSAYSKSAIHVPQDEVKSTFLKSEDITHPDIYWFHMDGMMSFDTVKTILGDEQESLHTDLIDRGFVINEDASLDIGWTAYAIPALTSPVFYENYLKRLMQELPYMTDMERKAALGDNTNIYTVYPKLELFNAFYAAGYQVFHLLFDIGRYFEKIPTKFSPENDYSQDRKTNLVELLAEHSALAVVGDVLHNRFNENVGFFENETEYNPRIYEYINQDSKIGIYNLKHYDWFLADEFEDVMGSDEPRFLYIQNFIPHCSFRFDDNGIAHQIITAHDMDKYLPQHRFAAKLTLGMIDRILEDDPDAVIIIQGDHGVHAFDKNEMYPQGFSDEQMLEMNYSTISAVRIPEKYGSLTEPLDPLDITRYLVNHYVGEGNYNYLYYHEEE